VYVGEGAGVVRVVEAALFREWVRAGNVRAGVGD
jgi:hypothetical protein